MEEEHDWSVFGAGGAVEDVDSIWDGDMSCVNVLNCCVGHDVEWWLSSRNGLLWWVWVLVAC